MPMETEARWYVTLDNGKVQCTLCPHNCLLSPGKTGICRVRTNTGGKLVTAVYGFVSAMHSDPIEKKPLYHFYPGTHILSIGTYGCNLRCNFCQNCSISQIAPAAGSVKEYYSPVQVVQLALQQPGNIGIAFTYNEPVVWFEYMYEIALLAKKSGLKTVMVTNGYINKEPLNELLPLIDAFSVDLKAFTETFYHKVTSSSLEPVKANLKTISQAGKHLEVVNLLIPGLNDDEDTFREMVQWISKELGKETILHISRYFPNYKLQTEATPVESISRLKQLAEKELNYVYAGNVNTGNNDTYCPKCHSKLIARSFYNVATIGLDNEGRCKICGDFFHKKT